MMLLGILLMAAVPGEHASEIEADRVPALETGGTCLIEGVTIHSAVGPAEVGDVLVVDGRIAAVGSVDQVPEGAVRIDGAGRHLAPGVVDCHSHMAIEGGVNEATLSITCDCDISDAVNPEDIAIRRALAGGVTTARLLHGSANTIGGRHEVIKLKWGRTADELRFSGAPEGVKFALGENVKRTPTRFPNTRMGVETVLERAFRAGEDYRDEWARFEEARARGEDPVPPRRDLRLEALSGILSGAIQVHSHCYRADEILMLLRAAERHGFHIRTLQHVLEGYKVAPEMAAHGVGGSTFSDWWAYKIEAYDAIPQNAALMDRAGVLTSINSDSDEMVRRLYDEAAKSIRYADMDPVRALGLVTRFPAQQLGIGDRVGTIEPGKDADLVLMDGDPLSAYSKVLWTMVDGQIEFERRDAFGLDTDPPPVRELDEQVDLNQDLWDPEAGDAVAIVGATLHPVTSAPIENGTLLLQAGRIARMGSEVEIPAGALVVDATGRHVWPGMIALNTSLGLFEIDAIPATVDTSESGGNQPDVRVAAALHADSAHIAVTRANGITRAQVAPEGGGPIKGQSAVIRLAGDTWEELLVRDVSMLHVAYPAVSNTEEDKQEGDAAKELRAMFRDARAHAELARSGSFVEHDPRLAALAPFATGQRPVALHADNAQTILYAIRFAQEMELDAVLMGLREGWKVADQIAASGFPAVVGPVLTLPSSRYDPYDSAYANAAVLSRAGVPVAIMAQDRANQRNLPFHAAMAAAFGLPREEALRAITWYPAEILGIEDEVGSLAPGKVADLVVTDGDLLETATHVESVWIDGVEIDRSNRQTRLYDRYSARIERLKTH